MSNVRPTHMNSTAAPCHATRASVRSRFHVGTRVLSPLRGFGSRPARAVRPSAAGAPPALCRERAISSRARSVHLVKQSTKNRAFVQAKRFKQEKVFSLVRHELSRLCTRFRPPTPAVRQLVSKKVAAQRSWCRQPRPNPSVEGMAKRLRLLSTPHLER